MNENLYLSTLAFRSGSRIDEIINFSIKNKIKIEFSSSLPHQENAENLILKSEINCLTHNYFPAPKTPFVLNLGSLDEGIRKKSVEHCINGLSFSKKISSHFFSAHFGFCYDFNPRELGGTLKFSSESIQKNKNEVAFYDSLKIIVEYAQKIGVQFLIENNVISKNNYINSTNPLLGCSSDEILKYINHFNTNYFGILLDTAHLKVSSNTLSFNLDDQIKKMKPYIYAIHHSDNDGLQDTNHSITKEYWFLKHQRLFRNITHVLEVKNINIDQVNTQFKYLVDALK